MDEPSTCGQGLASRSVLPARVSQAFAATARVLEGHMRALDPADNAGKTELEAYAALVTAHRDIADRLSGLADQMAGYGNLPMAPHDEAVMSDSVARKAFENCVRHQRELASTLQQLLHDDEQMLHQMSG